MAEGLLDKLKKIRKGVIEKADQGIQSVKGPKEEPSLAEVGKEVLKEANGLGTRLLNTGKSFVKDYMKENVTKDNNTGAMIGAFGEYLVKKTVKGAKIAADALTNYIENEACKYHKMEALPELEAARLLINEYAKDKSEQGEEAISYKGLEITLNKTEKELSVSMDGNQKKIKIRYLLSGNDIEELNKDLGYLTEDLIKRMDKLSDPDTVKISKKTTITIPRSKGETNYSVAFKKEKGDAAEAYEVSYTPNNKTLGVIDKKHGVVLEYALQKPMPKEEPKPEEQIPEMLKEK